MRVTYLRLSTTVMTVLAVLFMTLRASAAAACTDFSMSVDMASRAYVEWRAYVEGSPPSVPAGVDADQVQNDLAGTEYSVFEHEMDVAGQYSDACDESAAPDAWRDYYRLLWLQSEETMTTDANPEREVTEALTRAELDDLKGLYRLGYAKADPEDYAQMKAATYMRFRSLHLPFSSPETGQIVP